MENKIYTDDDFLNALKQKKRYMTVFFSVLGVYLAASLVFFFWFRSFPYKHPTIGKVKFGQYVLTALFVLFSYLFYNLKLKRVNAYCKTLGYISTGLKEHNYGEFLRFDTSTEVKENVEFKTLITSEWSQKKQEFFERKVLVDMEKPFPQISPGDKINYITQGNIIIEYEITKENN